MREPIERELRQSLVLLAVVAAAILVCILGATAVRG